MTLTALLPAFDTLTLSPGSVNPRARVVGPLSTPTTLTRKPVHHAPFQVRLSNHDGLQTAFRTAHATRNRIETERSATATFHGNAAARLNEIRLASKPRCLPIGDSA